MKTKFEYIWLDGYQPEPNLRSKTKVIDLDYSESINPKDLPVWFFDGSSTQQAEGNYSDCVLQPVRVIPDPSRIGIATYLVMCEVLNTDMTPHESNTRALIPENGDDFWYGFEQEYVLKDPKTGAPLGFADNIRPQGEFYCGVGINNTPGREWVESHFNECLSAGLDITGINAEVLIGQWEFQLLGKGKQAGDDLWLARYMLYRALEKANLLLDLTPKPIVEGDWNGSGMHVNFSNNSMRKNGGKDYFTAICEAFGKYHKEHIAEYGSGNELRLTGKHETASIDEFKYGISDRGASIRIPQSTAKNWSGHLEDRRPASNADPYRIIARILKTMEEVQYGK